MQRLQMCLWTAFLFLLKPITDEKFHYLCTRFALYTFSFTYSSYIAVTGNSILANPRLRPYYVYLAAAKIAYTSVTRSS